MSELIFGYSVFHVANSEGRPACGVHLSQWWSIPEQVVDSDERHRRCQRPGCRTATEIEVGA